MAKLVGLRRRRGMGNFEFRMRVPKDLVHILGPQRVFSHGTADRELASRRHVAALAEWYCELDTLRRAPAENAAPDKQIEFTAYRLAKEFYVGEIASRSGPPQNKAMLGLLGVDNESILDIEVELDQTLVSLINPDDDMDVGRRVASAAQNVASENGFDLDTSPKLKRQLEELVHRAMVEIAGAERAAFLGQAAKPEFKLLSATPLPALNMADLAEQFSHGLLSVEDRPHKTVLKHNAALSFLVWYFGSKTPAASITRAMATKFRDQLNELPSNRVKLYGSELRPDALIQGNGDSRYRLMAHATQSSYLQMAQRMFAWSLSEELVPKNPFTKLKSRAFFEPLEERRDPFSAAELRTMFTSPTYLGCIDDRNGFSSPGPHVIKRSRYWLPLLALFTGMRAGELLQLAPMHILVSPNGNPFFFLGKDMTLKTPGSRREVPMHPVLLRCGFMKFVEARQGSPDRLLFDDVLAGVDGKASSTWSKRFATFAKSVGVKKPSTKNCFHSFRHSFKDAADNCGMPEAYSDEIQGWTRTKTQGRTYGSGKAADLLAEWMNKVEVKGLDLSHLW